MDALVIDDDAVKVEEDCLNHRVRQFISPFSRWEKGWG
jgi:hypothetical protein